MMSAKYKVFRILRSNVYISSIMIVFLYFLKKKANDDQYKIFYKNFETSGDQPRLFFEMM